MALLETQRGVVFLEGSADLVPAGVMLEPASEHPDVQGDNLDGDNAPVAKPAKQPAKPANTQKAVEEVYAFKRWALKGQRGRQFNCAYLTEDLAKELSPDMVGDERVVFKAGDAGPKGTSPAGNETGSWSPYSVPS